MNDTPLRGIEACVFDAYGTLFDFAAATRRCKDELGENSDKLAALWRDKQLQYTWLRAVQGRHADFWQVTGDALDFSLGTLGLERPSLRERPSDVHRPLRPGNLKTRRRRLRSRARAGPEMCLDDSRLRSRPAARPQFRSVPAELFAQKNPPGLLASRL